MRKFGLLILVAASMSFGSCEKCVKCSVVYTQQSGNSNAGEEHTNELCDDITLSEAEAITAGLEAGGQIESGWSCK